jgi:tripartite-type tricarboxylate transporter receptor subunit TctC
MMLSSLKRSAWVAAVAVLSAAVLAPFACAESSDFPNKRITLVVGFAPGGSNDIIARTIAQPLAQLLGVPVVVENRVGAAAMIGANHVAKSNPDGYTLLVTSASPLVITPQTHDSVPYDAQKDFTGISVIGITPEALAINPKVPAANLKELLDLVKKKDLTLASAGSGGLPHLAIELFKSSAAGAHVVHVPYNGAGPAVNDALAGHVDGVVMDLPAVYTYIKAGRLRGIALANDSRSEFLPDLQTSGEQGLPGFVAVNWIGLLAPAKTPQPVIDKLHQALLSVMKTAEVKKTLAQSAVQVSVSETPADFQKFLVTEYEKWGKIVKDAGAKGSLGNK